MADQATLRSGGPATGNGKPNDVISGVGAFGSNLVNLASLQLKLAQCDAQDALTRSKVQLILIGAGLFVAPPALTVLIFGLGQWVADILNWPQAGGLILVAAALLILTLGGALWAVTRLGPNLAAFRRSQEELQRNISWIQTVLVRSGR